MTEPSQPLKLLLSDFALRTWGARIEAADADLSFVTAEEALAADGPSAIDIAFMTREVTGRSSKDNPDAGAARLRGGVAQVAEAATGCRSIRPAPSGRSIASCATVA